MKPIHFLSLFILWFCCCSTDKENTIAATDEMLMQEFGSGTAEVIDVVVSGEENAYIFSVTIKSPDTGCDQYADWWEVLSMNGELKFRRILAHSHVDEQPFARSGGPIEILGETEVYVRAHMNNTGYSNKVYKGSVANGFSAADLDVEFAQNLENTAPLPNGCAF